MADSAAVAAPAAAPVITDVRSVAPTEAETAAAAAFAAAAENEATGEDEAPTKPDHPPAKKAKPEPEPEAKPDAEEDEDAKPVPIPERARFRQEKRELRQATEKLQADIQQQQQLFQRERGMWMSAHTALNEGRVLDALDALGFKPETIAEALTKQAVGDDPRITAMQRRLAQVEAQRERERQEAEQAQRQQSEAQAQTAWKRDVTQHMATSGDAQMEAIAESPELVDALIAIQQEHFEEGHRDVATPKGLARAARELARRLEPVQTRLGRLYRNKVEEASETGGLEPSVAVPLQRTSDKPRKATRTTGAVSSTTKPSGPRQFRSEVDKDKYFMELLKQTTD